MLKEKKKKMGNNGCGGERSKAGISWVGLGRRESRLKDEKTGLGQDYNHFLKGFNPKTERSC